MASVRLIARLDVKGSRLIKGVHLEGLRPIGSPGEHALRYYEQGADELVYMDCVASLYGRNNLSEIVQSAAERIFIPMTVGGGIRSVEDATRMLRSGADKVAINTAAVTNPALLTELANRYGTQCVVLSVEAKQRGPNRWEAYTDNGRETTGMDAVEWCQKAVELGAGEILLTSVDREGTRRGIDVDLVHAVTSTVSVPVVASGGVGDAGHVVDAIKRGGASAVAMADILHYKRATIGEIRAAVDAAGVEVRHV